MITIIIFTFFTTNILNFCYAQFLPPLINSVQSNQGQNEELPQRFNYNPFSLHKNEPIDTGNDYYPQFSPNTPFMNQETLSNDKYNSLPRNYFLEPYSNLEDSQDNFSKSNEKKYNSNDDLVTNEKHNVLSIKDDTFINNTSNDSTNNIVHEKVSKKTNLKLEENKINNSKNLSGFFPYEFEKNNQSVNETALEKTNNDSNSSIHLPYKPLFPIFNTKKSDEMILQEKNNFPMPSKFSLLSGLNYDKNITDKDVIKSIKINDELKNKEKFLPIDALLNNTHDNTELDDKNKNEKEVNNFKNNESNNNLFQNALKSNGNQSIKPDKNGIPGFPPFPFGEPFNPSNLKGNNPNYSNGNKNLPSNIPNFPTFPGFGFNINNNNFLNTFLQIPKGDQSNMKSKVDSSNS